MSNSIGEILNSKRRELGFSQTELASALAIDGIEVTNQAISKWETGSTLPNARQFLALCRALEIDDISGTFDGGSRDGLLAGLNTVGRKKALDYIELLRDSGRYGLQPEPVKTRMLPLYSLAVSAGTGQFLDSEDYDMTEVGPEVPDGANFGVRVAGDSMEPRFHDGQTVWVSQQHSRRRRVSCAAFAESGIPGYTHLPGPAAARARQGPRGVRISKRQKGVTLSVTPLLLLK